MVKFEGKIGTLYKIFTPCTHCKFCMMFKRKGGGGVKGLLSNIKKKTALFSRDDFPKYTSLKNTAEQSASYLSGFVLELESS